MRILQLLDDESFPHLHVENLVESVKIPAIGEVMIKIDCKKYADEILDRVRKTQDKKTLMILTVGHDTASESYVRGKIKDCERCGVPYSHIQMEDDETAKTLLLYYIWQGNDNPDVGGIIVQLPLPVWANPADYVFEISPEKDVDGFRSDSLFLPCTPEGILYLLKSEIGENLAGKTALIVGKGKLVGKPLIDILLNEGCTVTIAHSRTTNLPELLKHYDIVITATGKAGLIDLRETEAEIVIDAGISRDENGKLCGDCFGHDYTDTGMKVTPVPGGVVLMTRAMLLSHMCRQ